MVFVPRPTPASASPTTFETSPGFAFQHVPLDVAMASVVITHVSARKASTLRSTANFVSQNAHKAVLTETALPQKFVLATKAFRSQPLESAKLCAPRVVRTAIALLQRSAIVGKVTQKSMAFVSRPVQGKNQLYAKSSRLKLFINSQRMFEWNLCRA